jgi:hypothetical protein
MKTFVWLLALAAVVVCISCWWLSSLSLLAFSNVTKTPPPHITFILLHPNTWVLFFPVPWIIYSVVLSLRKELAASSVFLFTGTLLLGLAIVV